MAAAPKRGPAFAEQEDALLREHYRKRGAQWCADHLPGRSVTSVISRARRIGEARCAADLRVHSSEWIDAAIRRAYTGERKVGFVMRCAKSVGRTKTWVSARALSLGLVPSKDLRVWTEEERAFASKFPLDRPVDLARKMRRRGWQRTPSAIAKMRFEGKVANTDDRRFSGFALAEAMGVGNGTVTGWIKKGWLRAERRGWDRSEAQHGDGYLIHERDVAQFLVQHLAHISLAKLEPNKFWVVDLLTRYRPKRTLTGRQRQTSEAA